MNHHQKIHDAIKKFIDITPQEFDAFISHSALIHLKAHEHLIVPGQYCNWLAYATKGVFRFYFNKESREITKNIVVEDTFFTANTAFITQTPSKIYIEAVCDSTILRWKRAPNQSLFSENQKMEHFGRRLIEELFLKKVDREISFLSENAEVRYQHLIQHSPEILQCIPQYQIASYLGITPESLSRIRKKITQKDRSTAPIPK